MALLSCGLVRRPSVPSLLCSSFFQQLLHRQSAAVANKSSDLLPAFSHPLSQWGSCFLALFVPSLSLWRHRTHSLFLPLSSLSLVSTRFLFFTISQTPLRHHFSLLHALFILSLSRSHGLTIRANNTCCDSRSLDKDAKKPIFYPQPEIVDNRRLRPTGHQFIFRGNTCAQ